MTNKTVLGIIVFLLLGHWLVGSLSNIYRSSTRREDRRRFKSVCPVIKSGKLRVGYITFPPYLNKDTSSGQLSGIFYDITQKLGRNLSLKVVWVEEAGLANLSAGFDANRYDLIAFPLWRNGARAKNVAFSTPLFYSAVGAYARAGDTRFDDRLDRINSPEITVAAIDGEMAGVIAAEDFPKAKVVSLPQLVDYTQLMLEVTSDKADVTFFSTLFANRFISKNPNSVKEISRGRPVRLYAECFILPLGDPSFASMIDSALIEIVENGGLEAAFRNQGEDPGEYFMRALPYRQPTTR